MRAARRKRCSSTPAVYQPPPPLHTNRGPESRSRKFGMLLQAYNQYWQSLREPRNLVDIALVFLLVYALLRLIRGTRAAPMAAGIGALALIYWAAARYDLATLEFILRPAPVYVGVAIVVLFQNEIRQALVTFGNRFRMPFLARRRG